MALVLTTATGDQLSDTRRPRTCAGWLTLVVERVLTLVSLIFKEGGITVVCPYVLTMLRSWEADWCNYIGAKIDQFKTHCSNSPSSYEVVAWAHCFTGSFGSTLKLVGFWMFLTKMTQTHHIFVVLQRALSHGISGSIFAGHPQPENESLEWDPRPLYG